MTALDGAGGWFACCSFRLIATTKNLSNRDISPILAWSTGMIWTASADTSCKYAEECADGV